jgi:hypothetical protein
MKSCCFSTSHTITNMRDVTNNQNYRLDSLLPAEMSNDRNAVIRVNAKTYHKIVKFDV